MEGKARKLLTDVLDFSVKQVVKSSLKLRKNRDLRV